MAVHFANETEVDEVPSDSRRPWTSGEWCEYFRLNAEAPCDLPWDDGARVTPAELAAIARSLQAWQLGETSDGRHLRAVAAKHARKTNDPEYATVTDWFIGEEQRHGELLGRFLDLAGVGRKSRDWGDTLFRFARYLLPTMETWTTPVVMVETLALVYYNAVRQATASPLLRAICRRILADEVPHLRFQCERLAAIYRRRSRVGFRLTMGLHRAMFLVMVTLVWLGHRRALRAGGYPLGRYWRASWDRMNEVWARMDPRRFDWDEGA